MVNSTHQFSYHAWCTNDTEVFDLQHDPHQVVHRDDLRVCGLWLTCTIFLNLCLILTLADDKHVRGVPVCARSRPSVPRHRGSSGHMHVTLMLATDARSRWTRARVKVRAKWCCGTSGRVQLLARCRSIFRVLRLLLCMTTTALTTLAMHVGKKKKKN